MTTAKLSISFATTYTVPLPGLKMILTQEELKKQYAEYVYYFDPTPQYLYDEPYRLLDYDEWLEETYAAD